MMMELSLETGSSLANSGIWQILGILAVLAILTALIRVFILNS